MRVLAASPGLGHKAI